jgi:hypothetical protein
MTLATIHAADRSAQVDLLRHRDHAHTALAPVGEQVDAVAKPARKAVQLPDHDGLDRAVEDAFLHRLESRPMERGRTLLVLEPAHRGQIHLIVPQSALDLGVLAVVLLVPRRDTAVAGDDRHLLEQGPRPGIMSVRL